MHSTSENVDIFPARDDTYLEFAYTRIKLQQAKHTFLLFSVCIFGIIDAIVVDVSFIVVFFFFFFLIVLGMKGKVNCLE